MSALDLKITPDFIPKCYYDLEGKIQFDPRVFVQRYSTCQSILLHEAFKGQFRKVIDYGCAEMKFFFTIKHQIPTVQHYLAIDVDEELLINHKGRIEPLICDYVSRRSGPLVVDVLRGSVADQSEATTGADAVICIELIEHLENDVLQQLPANIFGFIEPKIAVFTTPNCEINGIFPNMVGFRHDDHKFEWTRKEFEKWADEICSTYPKYSVLFLGVGPGPEGTEAQGCVSQLAVFLRSDMQKLVSDWNGGVEIEPSNDPFEIKADVDPSPYKLINHIEYPYLKDSRDANQQILDDAKWHLQRYRRIYSMDEDKEMPYKVPLETILKHVSPLAQSKEHLRTILFNDGFTMVNDMIQIPHDSSSSEGDYSMSNESDLERDEEETGARDFTRVEQEDNWD